MSNTPSSGQSALALRDNQKVFTPQQVATLTSLGITNATQEDLAIFFHQCQRTGLDPFARQIYMIARWSVQRQRHVQTIQTSIDGLRLVADRACRGTDDTYSTDGPYWCGGDGVWRDVWLASTPPAAAKYVVDRNGGKFSAVALFHEYAQRGKDQRPAGMWARMPAVMIAKCAEALALRKAFPQDLSGLYTNDEMAQADNGGDVVKPVEVVAAASTHASTVHGDPLDVLRDVCMVKNVRGTALEAVCSQASKGRTCSPHELTNGEVSWLVDMLKGETPETPVESAHVVPDALVPPSGKVVES